MTLHKNDTYNGFEQGPIRPPSEAYSLLLRLTRNCPWNHCAFCPVYKGTRFSVRPVAHVKRDIDAVHRYVEMVRQKADATGRIQQVKGIEADDLPASRAAFNWLTYGATSVFLQDANSLIMAPPDLVKILTHLKTRFPWVERVTSYARSHTVARMKDDDLKSIGEAGLNRIHIGLESGCDEVLKMVKKGVTRERQIQAGRRVKKAGIELSEYYMPGLGGRALSAEHARQTASALNQINPDFIRLRTLAIPNRAPLSEDYQAGRFEKCTDVMAAEEILTFIKALDGITSVVKSDHVLNLFGDLEGTLPHDKERMLAIPRAFLALEPKRQRLYQVGRRLGIFSSLSDMEDPHRLADAERAYRQLGVTPDNADEIVNELMKRFI
ncbi:MAG: coproporphyrinogen III oxidase [Anaerolineaceae bacterium 4572_32.2]|nr:MAG: coproporphyrinogen III oxidase [Anaerolineaceae bacterium 4572_32.2]HEY72485.1 radical SAM protein [Thermoflexia bacterium]